MTKRLLTTDKVLETLLDSDDDDQDYDDPDEPIMEGSDDEFSDLELDDEPDYDLPPPLSPLVSPQSPTSPSFQASPTSPVSPLSPQASPHSSPSSSSPSQPATWTSTLKPVQIKPFNSPVGPTRAIPETPKEILNCFLLMT